MIRVCIIDNNIELCETLEEYLRSLPDMDVVGSAYDGEEGLRVIAEQQPDVILLDISMPKLDGMAVLERLHELGLSKEPAVIVLTALGREDIMQRFTQLGAHYFIVKPFDLGVLADRIRQFAGSAELAGVGEKANGYRSAPRTMDMEVAVTELLHKMGIPAHFKGYTYLRDAVLSVLQDDEPLGGTLSKQLYPKLAEKYASTPGGVEAAIRNAVIASWEHGNRSFLEELTGVGPRGRNGKFPTNSMVIAKMANYLRMQGKVASGARASRALSVFS